MAQEVNLHLPETKPIKREVWMDMMGFSSMALAGFANAVKEVKHAEPDIWGVGDCFVCDESWKRKYKDYPEDKGSAYPFSKNVLAWTTDIDHLAGGVKTVGLIGGTILLTANEKFTWKTALRLAGGFVLYSGTSHVTYNHLRTGKPF